jgi:uncharacterized membrane protein
MMLVTASDWSSDVCSSDLWAAIIAAVLFAAMIPAFLGLLVALPVLGHATWHLYRGAVA